MRGLNLQMNASLKDNLLKTFTACGISIEENRGIPVVKADTSILIELMAHLKNNPECSFNVLIDLTAVDYLNKRPSDRRFDVVYLLWSTSSMQRVRVKVTVPEGKEVPTLTGLWKGANWPEREVFDLFGIVFAGHPVMERILMPEIYRDYPLRKDFPLEGVGEDYLIESILIDTDTSVNGNK